MNITAFTTQHNHDSIIEAIALITICYVDRGNLTVNIPCADQRIIDLLSNSDVAFGIEGNYKYEKLEATQ